MNILIIGYGSIGKRHFKILSIACNVNKIDLVTKQTVDDVLTYKNIKQVPDLEIYDYFVIASETIKHFDQLKYICSKVNNKKILVEKPLYDKSNEKLECNNLIFTAYNLRFHPVITKLKELLNKEEVYYANIICGQYLPTWRPNQDYTKSYSADLSKGGGVLRDLSHELDYINWLFGDIDKMDSINTKISDLEINSDDIFTAVAITNHKSIINLTVDYISKTPMRRLIIHTKNSTIEADMIKNIIHIYDKSSNVEVVEMKPIDRNYTYTKMHQSILDDNIKTICSFQEGEKVVEIIDNIEFKEL
ncbi:MAG: Gfo/Idh/MocA family oxidoreductase [Candidatus Endonucleobacter sp. (ex Gigantidas childressi)]|nr:Gfo/Idh/MocA family oxidoreductase [Candidatus Endonucleobacter sp. (ex Gigantidas childressi)]